MRADVVEEASVELVDPKFKAIVRLAEDFVCGWVEVAFSCNKRVVAEGLEALDLRFEFGTPSGSGIEECLPACLLIRALFVISLKRVGFSLIYVHYSTNLRVDSMNTPPCNPDEPFVRPRS